MILDPLHPPVGNQRNQTERDVEKNANETEPLGPFIWPRRREVQPGECRRKNARVDAEPPAMKGFDFAAGAASAALATTQARRFGELLRIDGFDLSLGLRAQFEDIGQLDWQPPFDKFLDQRFLASVIVLGFGIGPDPLREAKSWTLRSPLHCQAKHSIELFAELFPALRSPDQRPACRAVMEREDASRHDAAGQGVVPVMCKKHDAGLA